MTNLHELHFFSNDYTLNFLDNKENFSLKEKQNFGKNLKILKIDCAICLSSFLNFDNLINVEILSIYGKKFNAIMNNGEIFENLAKRKMLYLKEIELKYLNPNYKTEISINKFFKNLKDLRKVEILNRTFTKEVKISLLDSLKNSCETLEEFNILWFFDENFIKYSSELLKNLKILKLLQFDTDIFHENENLENAVIDAMKKCQFTLERLEFLGETFSENFYSKIPKLPNLRYLNILLLTFNKYENCYKRLIEIHNKCITHLSLGYCRNESSTECALLSSISKCSNLKFLKISGELYGSSNINSINLLFHLRNLENLKIYPFAFKRNDVQIFLQLLIELKSLKTVELGNFPMLRYEVQQFLNKFNNSNTNVETLKFSGTYIDEDCNNQNFYIEHIPPL